MIWYLIFRTPLKISIDDNDSIKFNYLLGDIIIPIGEIRSIKIFLSTLLLGSLLNIKILYTKRSVAFSVGGFDFNELIEILKFKKPDLEVKLGFGLKKENLKQFTLH